MYLFCAVLRIITTFYIVEIYWQRYERMLAGEIINPSPNRQLKEKSRKGHNRKKINCTRDKKKARMLSDRF